MKSIFKNNNRLLSIFIFLSFILAFLPFLFCLVAFDFTKLSGLVFFIPFLIVLLILRLPKLINKKYSKIANIISVILTVFIIIFVQIIIGSLTWFFLGFREAMYATENPKHYYKAINRIGEKERVAHFPKKIPEGAKNVMVYALPIGAFNASYITLKFDTDREYIEKELKKYKFIKVITPNDDRYPCSKIGRSSEMDITGFTFYIINDRDNEKLPGHHFPYHYGIGVNKDYTQIIYYYTDPD